jgi:hypothetical protein
VKSVKGARDFCDTFFESPSHRRLLNHSVAQNKESKTSRGFAVGNPAA